MSSIEGRYTLSVTFSSKYVPGRDVAYTYQTNAEFKPGDIAWVRRPDGPKRVRVIKVDAIYNRKALQRFGRLAWCYLEATE